ncbi:MAG: threonine synthase [Bacteroidota bacterium]
MNTLFTQLECSLTEAQYDKEQLQTYSSAHKPLLAKYDLSKGFNKNLLSNRPHNMWRYREVLPVHKDENIVSLGEGMTPILPFSKTPGVSLKDEALNPTGSFKARGLSMAISKAKELGVTKCVIPTAGNAGGAMSAYCAKAGIEAHVFMPKNTPEVFKIECQFFGAHVTMVDGTIKDCAHVISERKNEDWFNVSTLKEPYRLEGKKTMGYEIAEQLNWKLPDVIIYPTGGGTGLIGIWKAFKEMEQLGWISAAKKPRMVVVQTEACYPIVEAWSNNQIEAKTFEAPDLTMANGLRVPSAFGDQLILECIYESNGCAITVNEEEMLRGIGEVAKYEGILLSPEGSAVWKAYKKLLASKWLNESDDVLLINTGSFYKYTENI